MNTFDLPKTRSKDFPIMAWHWTKLYNAKSKHFQISDFKKSTACCFFKYNKKNPSKMLQNPNLAYLSMKQSSSKQNLKLET